MFDFGGIIGAKEKQQIYEAFENIYSVLKMFKKGDVAAPAAAEAEPSALVRHSAQLPAVDCSPLHVDAECKGCMIAILAVLHCTQPMLDSILKLLLKSISYCQAHLIGCHWQADTCAILIAGRQAACSCFACPFQSVRPWS